MASEILQARVKLCKYIFAESEVYEGSRAQVCSMLSLEEQLLQEFRCPMVKQRQGTTTSCISYYDNSILNLFNT